jgi:hypothetical protein
MRKRKLLATISDRLFSADANSFDQMLHQPHKFGTNVPYAIKVAPTLNA